MRAAGRQPGVHRLAVGSRDLFTPLERLSTLKVLCLEQERELALLVWIQQLEVEPLIGAMPRGCRSPRGRRRVVGQMGARQRATPAQANSEPGPGRRHVVTIRLAQRRSLIPAKCMVT